MESIKKILLRPEMILALAVIGILLFFFNPFKGSDKKNSTPGNSTAFSQFEYPDAQNNTNNETRDRDTAYVEDHPEKHQEPKGISQSSQLLPNSSRPDIDQEEQENTEEIIEGLKTLIATQQRDNEQQSAQIDALKSELSDYQKQLDDIQKHLSETSLKTKISLSENNHDTKKTSHKFTQSEPKALQFKLESIHGNQAWIKHHDRVYVVSNGDNIGDTKIFDVDSNRGRVETSAGVIN